MKKILTKKGIVVIIIPLFVIILQSLMRFMLGKDINTIGITLASIGLSQMLPFIYFDHFIANKVLGIIPESKFSNQTLSIKYKTSTNIPLEELDEIKNLFTIALLINFLLFLFTVYCGIEGFIALHIICGAISCIVSWFLLVFK